MKSSIARSYYGTTSFLILFAILVLYMSISFNILFLALIIPIGVILILKKHLVAIITLAIFTLSVPVLFLVGFGNRSFGSPGVVCGLIISINRNTYTITNLSIDDEPITSNLRLILNNSEKEMLKLNELSYMCIEGKFTIFNSPYGLSSTVEEPIIRYNFEVLANYKNLMRQLVVDPIDQNLGEKSTFLKALVLGIKDDLDKEDKNLFKDLGLLHVLVASGANILIIIGMIDAFLKFIKAKVNVDAYLLVSLKLFITLSYLLLVGLEGSLTRAFFFFIFSVLIEITQRDSIFIHKILLTTVLMLLFVPGLVFTISFLLSLSAVCFIELSQKINDYFQIENERLGNLIISILVPVFMLIPVSYLFGEVNLVSIFSNIILVPAIEVFVMIGFFFVVASIIANLLGVAGLLTNINNIVIFIIDGLNFLVRAIASFIPENLLLNFRINQYMLWLIITCLIFVYFKMQYTIYQRKVKSVSL